jgi:imidazolonepropionase-like amidohydrolase
MSEISVVHAAALLEPATGEVVANASVVIEDGVITAAGPRGSLSVPRDATVIDAADLTVLPGLIDCHVHLAMRGEGLDLGERLATSASLAVLETVLSCRRTLQAGFTTVRDAGFTPNGVRTAVERGYFPGPRMRLAITILSQTGGHADNYFPCGQTVGWNPSPDLPGSVVDGIEPMRLRVRETIRAGADWIKLCTSGGVLSPSDSPHHANFTLDEVQAAVDEAAAQSRRVMAHAVSAAGVKNALRAGVDTIEHGIWLDDEAIQLLLDRRATLVPTLIAPIWVIRHADAGRMPAWATEKARQAVAVHKASVQRAIKAGVRIAYGTDSGVGPHGTNGEELLHLRELGMSPLDCLRAATNHAAEALELDGRVGTLSPGAFGDLVGVAGDPLERLELLASPQSVALVVKDGAPIKTRVAV